MILSEFKKLFHTKLLYISLFLGLFSCILGLVSYHNNTYFMIAAGRQDMISSYQAWLECLSMGSSIYRLIFPLLIVPYLDSYYIERKSGYQNFVLSRVKRRRYFFSKLSVGIISAAANIASILLLTLLVCVTLYPENSPLIENTYINYPVAQALFISKPLVFIFLTILSNMFQAAVYFSLGFSLSCCAKNRYSVLLTPFVVYLIQLLISQALLSACFVSTCIYFFY